MTQPYAAIRDGDAPLCSANDFGSRMIRWASRSQWSHCAIAFRMREIDRVLVLECVQRMGVRAVSLSDFVARTSSGVRPYAGRIVQARHRICSRARASRAWPIWRSSPSPGRATNSPNGKP